MSKAKVDRRQFIHAGLSALGVAGLGAPADAQPAASPVRANPTQFQIACMTLPYGAFPLERALSGLKSAGYRYIAWGTNHRESDGKSAPVLAPDAPYERAKDLANRCRDLGLEPVMMFGPNPDNVEPLKHRVLQAAAAGIPQ